MKKSRKMFSLAILFSLALMLLVPFGSASAYSGGLLDGKSLSYYTGEDAFNGYETRLTDGDETTYANLTSNASVFYQASFTTAKDINTIKNVSEGYGKNIKFYDSSGAFIKSQVIYGESSITVDVKGVKTIKIYNASASITHKIYEIDFLGVDAGTVVDTTPPMNPQNFRVDSFPTEESVTLKWDAVNDTDLDHYSLYQNGSFLGEYTNTSATRLYQNGDTFKVTSVDTSGNESSGVSLIASSEDMTPPSEITNLVVNETQTTVDFSFSLPLDDDFDKVNVYQNGVQIGTTNTSQFSVTGLTAETSYSFKFTSVDLNGNESAGTVRSVTTLSDVDDVAPSAPDGLSLTENNGSLTAYWSRNLETDAQGYNVYVDGVKHNSSLVTANSYIINGLENGISYDVYITAVDTSGNESLPSLTATNSPDLMAVPTVSMDYTLGDVADGTSTWFSSIWLIVAFASAIPLAFYVANRIKLLFVA